MLMLLYKKEMDKSINKQDYNILMTLHLSDVFSIIFSLCNDFLHNVAKCITYCIGSLYYKMCQCIDPLMFVNIVRWAVLHLEAGR